MSQTRPFLSLMIGVLASVSLFNLKAADERQADLRVARERVKAGDMNVVSEAAAAKDFSILYSIFSMATGNQMEKTEATRLADLTRQALVAIPGHAKYLADQIDTLSNLKGTSQQRQKYFLLLGRLGSPEAIQQAGRFLDDERNPEADRNLIQRDVVYRPNNAMAWWALQNLVMDDLDLPSEIKKQYKGGNFGLGMQVEAATHAWWESDKSLPYRQGPNAETKPPPSVKQMPSVTPHVPGTPQPPPSPKSILDAEERSLKIWIVGALLVAISASLVVLLVRRSKL